jgi:hypothetical protein
MWETSSRNSINDNSHPIFDSGKKRKKFRIALDKFYNNYIIILYTGIGYMEYKDD